MSEWISVNERIPAVGQAVLCCFIHWNKKIPRYDVLVFSDESDCLWRVWDLAYMHELSHDYNVTHWMPLPPPPKESS